LYPWDLLRLNATALKAAPEVRSGTIEPAVTIRGRVSIGDGCVIRSGAYLQGPLSLGPGCEIGPNAVLLPSTSLGKNVRIGAHTSVANSILMDDVILGPASVVQDGVIGSGVVARAGLLAASGAGDVQIEGEWHAVPQLGALIGEDVEIANGASVAPGTIINERARIESGARLRGTIPSGAVVREMCGIVGYAGRRNALPILLDGLKRLEYRGYDSAGVAIVGSGLQVVKDKGFIANLEAQLPPLIGSTGFAHTRWAT